jgi:hypothetical protein
MMANFPCHAHRNAEQLSIGNEEVGALLRKGEEVRSSNIGFVSSMFIINNCHAMSCLRNAKAFCN